MNNVRRANGGTRGASGGGPRGRAEQWEDGAVASPAAADADTFPKLLIHNAQTIGARPAVRHKDLGIWHTWTWAQMLDEIRAFSVGLEELGISRGDKFAIIGGNRPKLYWAMCAGQALGAVPVPLYADAVAEEMAYVLDHAEVKLAVVEDQEQVDKILSISDRLSRLGWLLSDEPRGLRGYDHARLKSLEDFQNPARQIPVSHPGRLAAWAP